MTRFAILWDLLFLAILFALMGVAYLVRHRPQRENRVRLNPMFARDYKYRHHSGA